MQLLCEDSEFSDLEKFWIISKVKIHMQFFFISFNLEFVLLLEFRKKIQKIDILGRKTVFSDLIIVGNFREIPENAILQDHPYPWKSMCRNVHLYCSKTPQKCVSPKKLFHPKRVTSKKSSTPNNESSPKIVSSSKKSVSPEKRVSPEKMFHLKNLEKFD